MEPSALVKLLTANLFQNLKDASEAKRITVLEEIEKQFSSNSKQEIDLERLYELLQQEFSIITEKVNSIDIGSLFQKSQVPIGRNEKKSLNSSTVSDTNSEADYNFLVIASDKEIHVCDVVTKLKECFKQITSKSVNIIICNVDEEGFEIPSLEQMCFFSALFIWTYRAPQERYVETISKLVSHFLSLSVGGVVICHAAIRDDAHAIHIPDEYLPVTRGEWLGRAQVTWKPKNVNESNSILKGVTSIDSGAWGSHTNARIVQSCESFTYTPLSEWSDGTILVAQTERKESDFISCVALNILPPSSDADKDFWPAPCAQDEKTSENGSHPVLLIEGPTRLFCNALLACTKHKD